MKREMSVNGAFYPNEEKDILKYFNHFNNIIDEHIKLPDIQTKAVIVPHAGYVYSGFSANIAYRILQNSGVKRFVVIGPSHKVAFKGSTLCEFENYITPLGNINADKQLYKLLKEKFKLPCFKEVFKEHSTEVQFPFIKHYIKDASIVELIYSDENPSNLSKIIEFILDLEDVGVIISTDLSHFYDLKKANELDNICIEAIEKLDTSLLDSGCEACGKRGVWGVVDVARKKQLSPLVLDYRTSADVSGDKSRVVGYLSVAFM